MSEVKTQGAPDRIWTQLDYSVIPFRFSRECSDEKSSEDDIEYIRANIARELAEALMAYNRMADTPHAITEKGCAALDKYREVTEETE